MEYFFLQIQNVPLKASIDGIKYDPNCLHKTKLMTSSQTGNNQIKGMKIIFFIYFDTIIIYILEISSEF